jgi:IS30 family transposase
MRRGRYRMFTSAQCAELWSRYKAGESVDGIGRALGSVASTVRRELQYTGGIAPAQRRRSARVLSLIEREEVSRGIAAGCTIRSIARTLNRAPSTVSQEVSRHGGRELYRAAEADLAAWRSARRPKLCLLAKNRELQRLVGRFPATNSRTPVAGRGPEPDADIGWASNVGHRSLRAAWPCSKRSRFFGLDSPRM